MADPKIWKGVAVDMQSAIAAPKTIASIARGHAAVVGCPAHGYADGDILFLEVQGMHQLHDRVFRVDSPLADSFQLEGVDSTDFSAFISGTARKITLGTPITTATTISSEGGDFGFVPTTTIHDNMPSQIPDMPAPASYRMDHIWSSKDPGLLAMKQASDLQQKRVFRFNIAGDLVYFAGYVGCTMVPGGAAKQLVSTKSVFTINGSPTYY